MQSDKILKKNASNMLFKKKFEFTEIVKDWMYLGEHRKICENDLFH